MPNDYSLIHTDAGEDDNDGDGDTASQTIEKKTFTWDPWWKAAWLVPTAEGEGRTHHDLQHQLLLNFLFS